MDSRRCWRRSRRTGVLVEGGAIHSFAPADDARGRCAARPFASGARVIDLTGGALAPGLTHPSTTDGRVFDPLTTAVPSILRDTVVRAVDGLLFGSRNTLYAYRGVVTTAVVARMGSGFLQGISTAFSTTAPNALAYGAILQSETALHISIHSEMRASMSTQIATPHNILFSSSAPGPWTRINAGEIPLLIRVHNADSMATLLLLKGEFEVSTSTTLRMTFAGATEVRLLAALIGAAGVSVILAPARAYPESWDSHRMYSSQPPLSRKTAVTTLLQHGATLALGVQSAYGARNVIYARFELAWAALDADGATSTSNVSAEDLPITKTAGCSISRAGYLVWFLAGAQSWTCFECC
ncbi:hypothetical protein FB451DRAFT_1411466 [Mycena latifolia]|nr:hypothetical protein FB451DRAFT_1411466 [Mycena latifolia]